MLGSPCQGPSTGLTPPISTPCPAHLRAALRASLRSLERGADGAHSAFAFNSIPPVKNGTTKATYPDRSGAEAKAREFLRSAKTAAELAGRQLVLLAMARYADEQAIAQSQRSFYTLSPGSQLPFSGEVIETLDELCAEKLPAHVLDRGREQRQEQAAERAKDREDRAWLEQQHAALEAMTPEQRQAVLEEHERRFGPYGGQRWQLEQRIRELAEAETTEPEPTQGPEGPDDGEEGAAA